jgi:two-component system LytT family sensor kinase
MSAPHPSSTLPAPRFSRAQTWTVLFLFFTGIAFLSFNYKYLDDLARQHSGTLLRRLLEETTGVYSFFILLPIAFHFAHIYLFERKGWLRQALMHLATGVGFSVAHTTLMALSRRVLAPLIGLGPYDYGIMTYRYPMEFSNDFIAFTFIIGLYYFFQRMRLAQARELAAAELQTKLAQAQLENLRLQLQPHFLFNTLNTISSIMYEDVRAADAMINQLSDLLRLTLRVSGAHEIPLSEELEITRLYLDLMQKRYENKLQVMYSIDPALGDSLVPQLILQPLLENSLRHGMKPGGTSMELSIAARRENGSLVLQVSDTGVGLHTGDPEEVFGKGLGLSNIRERLAQLYRGDAQFRIADRPAGGTDVTLSFPCRTSPQSVPSSQ